MYIHMLLFSRPTTTLRHHAGIFGGNFHTHNSLYLPPGLDVVCYSSGHDYVRGIRYALQQASRGRMVMSVDCTHLLNIRHLHDKDNEWMHAYPGVGEDEAVMPFDKVTCYGHSEANDTAVVTYGDGVLSALQAKAALETDDAPGGITVIDSPLLSRVPEGLTAALSDHPFQRVVFADICKQGQNPLNNIALQLRASGALSTERWDVVTACPTYNPLGSTVTFLNTDDVIEAIKAVRSQ